MKILTNNVLMLMIISMTALLACEKDRIEDVASYTSLDEFYDKNKPEEQEFIIDSTGTDSIVGKEGTYIWNLAKTNYMYKSNHQDITYPYALRLIEAYTLKNMILSELPSLAQGQLLRSGGEIKITAWKNNEELLLKENKHVAAWSPAATPDNAMGLYYGFTKGSDNDWNSNVLLTDYLFAADNVTSITATSNGYNMKIAKLGWENIARLNVASNKTIITFTADGTNTEMIDIYVIFKHMNAYVKASAQTLKDMPMNNIITVFAIGKDSKGDMRYHNKEYTITENLVVDLDMQKATEADILAMMAKL